MYEDFFAHFGLRRNPFQVSPDSTHYFSTTAHDEALLQLVSRIEVHQGFMVVTGEAGTGKSTVLQYLLDWLKKYGYSSAYIFHPHVTFQDLLQMILEEFGVPFSAVPKSDLLAILKNWLIDRYRAGDSPVILIDEAQSLRSRTLNQFRRLLDFEVQGTKLVQIILAGQPRLEEKLQQHRLLRLRARVKWQYRLPAFTPEETYGYIGTRLALAGAANAAVFQTEAVQQVYRYSKGIPRVINLLCEHACLTAYGDGRNSVTGDDVWRVACQFELAGTAEWKSEVLPAETFCRLRRPKETQPATAVVEVTQPSAEHFVSAVAVEEAQEAIRDKQVAVTAACAHVEQPVLATAGIAAPVLGEADIFAALVAEQRPQQEAQTARQLDGVAAPGSVQEVATEPVPLDEVFVARDAETPQLSSLPAQLVMEPLEPAFQPAAACPSEIAPEPTFKSIPVPSSASVREVQPIASRTPKVAWERCKNLAAKVIASLPKVREVLNVVPIDSLLRFRTRCLRYCHGVGCSFARDLRQLFDECEVWLQSPVRTEENAAAVRRVALSVSTWLRQPVGIGLLRRGHSRIPSTAHKHP